MKRTFLARVGASCGALLVVAALAVAAAVPSLAVGTDDPAAKAAEPVSGAAVSTPYATITAGGGSCSVNVGLAFDGSRLLVSCSDDSRINAVSPANGALIQTYNVPGLSSLGALAWDGARSVLYGCNSSSNVTKIDLVANTSTMLFSSTGCYDGLAYDGSDDSFWASGDASSTITHYTYTGSVIGTHNFGSELGGFGNSGIAVGGPTLYLANNGGSQIYTSDKAFASVVLFATLATRLEDMECDNVTFAGQNTDVMWVIDAYDRVLSAFTIPLGTCGFGGAAPPAAPPAPEPIVIQPTFTG